VSRILAAVNTFRVLYTPPITPWERVLPEVVSLALEGDYHGRVRDWVIMAQLYTYPGRCGWIPFWKLRQVTARCRGAQHVDMMRLPASGY